MIEGLKDRTNSGRPPELSKKVSFQIKKEPSKSKQEWITKQIEELIVKKKDMKHHYIHIYRISFSK
jgi:transposase